MSFSFFDFGRIHCLFYVQQNVNAKQPAEILMSQYSFLHTALQTVTNTSLSIVQFKLSEAKLSVSTKTKYEESPSPFS